MPNFTLTFKLCALIQSWGVQSQFGHRETMKEPTKSGVVGLLAAALGRQRHEDISDLAALKMAVLVLQEGQLLRDFHTAGIDGFLRASGAVERKNPIVSTRFYLTDAQFLVALQHENQAFLESLQIALQNPVYPLYLGRKSCPPVGLQQSLLIRKGDALESLKDEANALPINANSNAEKVEKMRYVADMSLLPENATLLIRTQPDHPISFSPRKFALRRTGTDFFKNETTQEA